MPPEIGHIDEIYSSRGTMPKQSIQFDIKILLFACEFECST